MSLSPLVVAPVALAVVLIMAAVGKLRSPAAASAAFVTLRVPHLLRRRWIVRGHPWFELVLAVGLLVAWSVPLVVVGALTLLLMAGYLILIIRALLRDETVPCDCFGASEAPIRGVTAARNISYLVLAAASLVLGVLGGGVPRSLMAFTGADWLWLVGAAVAVATAVLTVVANQPGPTESASSAPVPAESADDPDDEFDYIRRRTPAVPVSLAGGDFVTLRQLATERAQLLLFVSETCGWCENVMLAAPGWAASLPQLDVHLVRTRREAPPTADESTDLFDPKLWAYDTLEITGVPSAVLLGVDGQLAGGPVIGFEDVSTFVEAIRDQLTEAQAPEDQPQPQA